jgi:hypothetical protein
MERTPRRDVSTFRRSHARVPTLSTFHQRYVRLGRAPNPTKVERCQ